jgi:hypothetical protein
MVVGLLSQPSLLSSFSFLILDVDINNNLEQEHSIRELKERVETSNSILQEVVISIQLLNEKIATGGNLQRQLLETLQKERAAIVEHAQEAKKVLCATTKDILRLTSEALARPEIPHVLEQVRVCSSSFSTTPSSELIDSDFSFCLLCSSLLYQLFKFWVQR